MHIPVVIAVLVCFLGSVAMWWVYFDSSAGAASHALTHAREPGQMAACVPDAAPMRWSGSAITRSSAAALTMMPAISKTCT